MHFVVQSGLGGVQFVYIIFQVPLYQMAQKPLGVILQSLMLVEIN